jgi:VWFA-related protein
MMKSHLIAMVTTVALAGASWQTGSASTSGFVDIDAVVVDAVGQPVRRLQPSDFELREDGRPAPVLTVEEISRDAEPYAREARLMALVLDDLAIPPMHTATMQDVARAFLARASVQDRIAVLQLSRRNQELLFGSLSDALIRIRNYTAEGRVSFDDATIDGWLSVVASISHQFGEADGRRKPIVAIGSLVLLDPLESTTRFRRGARSPWLETVAAAARANTVVYVVDPGGINNPLAPAIDSLTEQTGGLRFSTLNLSGAFAQIWRDIGHYYVLSYVPLRPRRVHSIAVSVKRPGIRVRARRVRGE